MANIPASSVLKEIQWQQPRQPELVKKLQKMLEQYWVTPQTEELIAQSAIPQLLIETKELAKDVWDKLADLRIETMIWTRMGDYNKWVVELAQKNSRAIHDIMFYSHW